MIQKIFAFMLDLFFPRRCPVCGEITVPRGALICRSCLKKLSFVKTPVCKKCGKELENPEREYCFDCSRGHKSFEYGVALLNYDSRARHSMAKIKYNGKKEYLDFYGEALWLRYQKQFRQMKPDALVPVPVHSARKRMRGYNQAEVLARRLSAYIGVPVKELLVRTRRTAPQKELGPRERLENLRHAFAPAGNVKGIQSVLLVDDIYTTGSTVEACARILKKMGIKQVYFVVICIGHGVQE